jgi:hypothetical protein
MLRHAYDDMWCMEALVKESGLERIIIRYLHYLPAGESRGQSRRLNAGLVLACLTDDCFGSIKESQGKEMKAHVGL